MDKDISTFILVLGILIVIWILIHIRKKKGLKQKS